ncbi:MAG: ABC transporter ATP-binding protein [Gammaproteobacteria bacterium]|nr:ABC transporter ATP-binding protein [Gammaproteobacteria bacterium]
MSKSGVKMVNWSDCWLDNQLIVEAGTIDVSPALVVVSGGSGVGKTTLLRAISRQNPSLRPRLVFQEPTLLPWLTVTENLSIVCEDIESQTHWLSLFDLSEVGQLRPGQLSLGMQRRIAIVRGILARPRLLLLDEPSASLDPANVERLISNIRAAISEESVPTIIVTHSPRDFEALKPSYFELTGRPAVLSQSRT